MPKVLLLADFSEEYFKRILLGIARYARENGTWVFCRMPSHYREQHGFEGFMDWAKNWGADGIFAQLNTEDDTPLLNKTGIPIIVPDSKERFKNVPNITGDYQLTGAMAAEYFVNKGYRNFAFYGYSGYVWSRERAKGFSDALTKKAYTTSFFYNDQSQRHEMWYYQPSALSQWLDKLPKPVAIMACDDNSGQQITEACKLIGLRIPEEVAVIGVDNDELICNLSDPPLSSISLNCEQGGYKAAMLMEQLIANEKTKATDIVVQPLKIITRQSTDTFATADPYLAKVLKYIHQNYKQPITIKEIADQAPLSRRSLELKFRAVTGKAVYEYIIGLRMNYIAKQLIETDRPINEIASDVGIFEAKNVSRQFKKLFGCTPLVYRQKAFS